MGKESERAWRAGRRGSPRLKRNEQGVIVVWLKKSDRVIGDWDLGSVASEPRGIAHLRESALRENAGRVSVSWLFEEGGARNKGDAEREF